MTEGKERAEARIHIDRQEQKSPNPTTGEALYGLGEVPQGRELFRVVGGDHEDEVVPRDDTTVHLKMDEHFYSQKTFDIVVNAEQHFITEKNLSFDEVAKLAFPVPPPGADILYTIAYRKGPPANPKGSLLEGHSVKLKDGMIFDVAATDKS